MHLLILAKRPLPGRAKTRLIPAFGIDGAAALAAAALADTCAAALASAADEVVVAFDGDPTGIVPAGCRVVPQRTGDLAARLAGAWADAGGPGLQIGMDTPQVTARALDDAMAALAAPRTDAVLGLAEDGGWWAIGLRRATDVFAGIPTSRADTGRRQLGRLHDLGLRTTLLPTVRDVDHPADAVAVAELAPDTRFAQTVAGLLAAAGPLAAPRSLAVGS